MSGYLLALGAVACTSVGQLCLKQSARTAHASAPRRVEFAWLGAGYALLMLAVGMSTHALRQLEVNVLVSLTALSYPLVVGLSRVLFAERLAAGQWSGLLLVCIGVVIYNLG